MIKLIISIDFLKKIFIKAPFFIKRLFSNAEAIRRDYYRRWGCYKKLYQSTDMDYILKSGYKKEQERLFSELIEHVSKKVVKYKNTNVKSLSDIKKLPLLTKYDLIHNIDETLSYDLNKKKCYVSTTSGSTGAQVKYYQDRKGLRLSYLYADKMLETFGLTKKDKIARISGVPLIPFESKKPPFWVYIDKYRQLQMSAFHINNQTCKVYLDAIKAHKATFGTGYSISWFFLAEYILENKITPPYLKAIVSDSEGLSIEQIKMIEQAFRCKVYMTYGLSETGQVAFMCKFNHYHFIPSVCYAEIIDNIGKPVDNGTIGEIILTSLIFKDTPFIRYKTGDLGALGTKKCLCGWETQYLTSIEGRTDDYLLTPDGRKIGPIGFLVDKGVIHSQIIQKDYNNVIIKILPAKDFDEKVLLYAINKAKQSFLGDINVTWELTDKLEKTKAGKIKHVIRRF